MTRPSPGARYFVPLLLLGIVFFVLQILPVAPPRPESAGGTAVVSVGDRKTLDRAYLRWKIAAKRARFGERLELALQSPFPHGAARGAGGTLELDLVRGTLSLRTAGLPAAERFELWATGRSESATARHLRLGEFRGDEAAVGVRFPLAPALAAGLAADRFAVVPAGSGAAEEPVLAASPSLFQRMFYAEERARPTPVAARGDEQLARPWLGLVPEPAFAAAAGSQPLDSLIARGESLFVFETFGGNGRTCATCHPPLNNFTIDTTFIASLPPNDPLFVAEFDPNLEDLENPVLMRLFAMILENVDGFEDPTNKFVMRGVPHTLGLGLTIAASETSSPDLIFAAPDPGSAITTATPCVSVPVHFTRVDATPLRAYSVTIELSPNLSLCGAQFVAAGYPQAPTQLFVTPLGGNRWVVDEVTLGAPCGAIGSGTLFTLDVTSAETMGTGTITVLSVLARDCDNRPIPASAGGAVSVMIGNGVPPPVAPQDRVGWGGDGAPNQGRLRDFATGAVRQHFTQRLDRVPGTDFRFPTAEELDALEAFQLSLGRSEDPHLGSLVLTSPLAENGRQLFRREDSQNGTLPAGKCTICHVNGGALSNLTGFNDNFDTGIENRVHPASLTGQPMPNDGGFGTAFNPVLNAFGNGEFNSPSLIETADTPPFFHNNIDFNLANTVAFYSTPVFNNSPAGVLLKSLDSGGEGISVESGDITAFLRVLNTLENLRSAVATAARALDCEDLAAAAKLLTFASSELVDAQQVLAAGGLHPDARAYARSADSLVALAIPEPDWGIRNARVGNAISDANTARNLMVFGGTVDATPARPAAGALQLATGFPNPFTASTVFSFTLPHAGRARLAVYDVGGRHVRTLADGSRDPGSHTVRWDGRTEAGRTAPSGSYFVRLDALGESQVRTVVRLR